jgi:hypothetical protein
MRKGRFHVFAQHWFAAACLPLALAALAACGDDSGTSTDVGGVDGNATSSSSGGSGSGSTSSGSGSTSSGSTSGSGSTSSSSGSGSSTSSGSGSGSSSGSSDAGDDANTGDATTGDAATGDDSGDSAAGDASAGDAQPGDGGDDAGGGDATLGDGASDASATDAASADGSSAGDAASADGADIDAAGIDAGTDGGTPDAGGDGGAIIPESVLMHHNHINRDGFFVDPKLTKAAAATMHNDTTFNATIAGAAYATPLFVEAGVVPSLNGGRGALFVATESNDVYALDEATGAQVWHRSVVAAATGNWGCGDIHPLGVTGTPAIDLAANGGNGLLVFDAATGTNLTNHIVFGLDLATGNTVWQVPLAGTKDGNGNKLAAQPANQRSAVLIVNGYAYVAFGGHIGDCGGYNGWVIGVPLDGNAAGVRAWRTNSDQSGIWGPGGPASDGQSIFVTTGNIHDGTGGTSWAGSEGVIRLGLDLSFTKNAVDYYAPSDWHTLDGTDTDISGSGPLVIDAPSMTPSKLVMALGKNGDAYLLDPGNLGGVGGTVVGHTNVSNGAISNAAAWATIGGSTYVVGNNNWTGGSGCANGGGDLFALKLDPSAPNKMTEVWCGDPGGYTSPIITSSDGSNDAIVWVQGSTSKGGADTKLHAYDLLTGAPIANSVSVPGVTHLSPTLIAAHGRIFVASTNGHVYAATP